MTAVGLLSHGCGVRSVTYRVFVTLVLDVRTSIWHRNDIVVALLRGRISHCLDGDSGQQHQIWNVGGVVPLGFALA